MKVLMKQFEIWCEEYCNRWNKKTSWDFYCLVKDAWINGYKKGIKEINELNNRGDDPGQKQVETEMVSPQIGQGAVFSKEQFKRDMQTFYNCKDVQVNISENGLVSFQGTFKV